MPTLFLKLGNINMLMKLSIVTINYNNAVGLRKTLASVASQTYPHIEHIIVDGGSTDGSVEILRAYPHPLPKGKGEVSGDKYPTQNPAHKVIWVSEKDNGIYNAMNKGIRMATSEYIQILNSGDILAAPDVTERMMAALEAHKVKGERLEVKGEENGKADAPASTPYTLHPTPTETSSPIQNLPAIFYGNMTKVNASGQVVGKSGYTEYSLRQFYRSTLNHDCAYIRADLFEQYGLYDENLKIVSDWKWYLQTIGLGRVKPEYVDIDVTIFDDGGISETNLTLRNKERRQVLEELLPPAVLWDYDMHAFEMEQMNRLHRWKLYPIVYFMERVCFKFEKWGILGERRKVRG